MRSTPFILKSNAKYFELVEIKVLSERNVDFIIKVIIQAN